MRCDVIIPVGPGHEDLVAEAAHSVAVAVTLSTGPFDEVAVRAVDDTKGEVGRSAARNKGVAESDADWVYFLDADDMVLPSLFESVFHYLTLYDAIWGMYGEMEGVYLKERYQTWGIDSLSELLSLGPHITIKMGHFIKREIAEKYPFNTKMNAGEDWEYYLRVWKNERCFKAGGGMVYAKRKGRHSTGPRSATGKNWNESVDEQIRRARIKEGIT